MARFKKKTGWLGMIPASLLGIASPLCMYGTIPIAAAFSQQGIADDILSAFMMSSILLNPQLILYSGARWDKRHRYDPVCFLLCVRLLRRLAGPGVLWQKGQVLL